MSVRPTRCRDLFYDAGPLSPPSPMLGGSWWELVKGIAPTLEMEGGKGGGVGHYDLSLLLPSKVWFFPLTPVFNVGDYLGRKALLFKGIAPTLEMGGGEGGV